MKRRWLRFRAVAVPALAVAFVILSAVATAQADWPATQTGTFEFQLAGQNKTFYTFAVEIPENVADGHPEGPVRDRLMAAAGTTEHWATWHVEDPVEFMGRVLSTPSTMGVTLTARPTQDQQGGLGVLMLNVSLELTDLTLSDPGEHLWNLRYYPENYGLGAHYAMTEGAIEVTGVQVIDDHTLRIQGSFAGTLSLQQGLGEAVRNPDDAIAISGTFDVEKVVGSKLITEVLINE